MTAMEWLREAVSSRDRSIGCWEDAPWKATTPGGYPVVKVKGRTVLASRIVLELDGRPQPPGTEVLHSCDHKRCLNPRCLSWGTRSKNMQEVYDRGLKKKTVGCSKCDRPHRAFGLCTVHYSQQYSKDWFQRVGKTRRMERAMALRDKLVELADEFWSKGVEAAERKSWIEANTYKAAANRLREALGMEPLS